MSQITKVDKFSNLVGKPLQYIDEEGRLRKGTLREIHYDCRMRCASVTIEERKLGIISKKRFVELKQIPETNFVNKKFSEIKLPKDTFLVAWRTFERTEHTEFQVGDEVIWNLPLELEKETDSDLECRLHGTVLEIGEEYPSFKVMAVVQFNKDTSQLPNPVPSESRNCNIVEVGQLSRVSRKDDGYSVCI